MNSKLKIIVIGLALIAGVRLLIAIWNWGESKAPSPAKALARRLAPVDKPYIEISLEARTRLLEKVKQIKIGDPIEDVIEHLGRPGANLTSSTQPAATQPVPVYFHSTLLPYYIRKRDRDSFDETFDEHIYVFLDDYDIV